MTDIEKTLAERGARYGDFTVHAKIAQRLQNVMRGEFGWEMLSPDKAQALTVIADKIARILSGDPEYTDNWIDISGYAKLAEDRCKVEDAEKQPPLVYGESHVSGVERKQGEMLAKLKASEPWKLKPAAPKPQPDADGWIPWGGGECPVKGSVNVLVRLRDGYQHTNPAWARSYRWSNGCVETDIIAYKVVQP